MMKSTVKPTKMN